MEPIRYSGKAGDGNQVVVNGCDGFIPALREDTSQGITKPAADDFVVGVGPTTPTRSVGIRFGLLPHRGALPGLGRRNQPDRALADTTRGQDHARIAAPWADSSR